MPAANSDVVDAAGLVIADCACRRCGYNLRGLSESGKCPECGTAVGRSTLGDLLKYSDPNWLGTLQSGVNLIFAGILVSMLGSCLVSAAQAQSSALGELLQVAVGLIGLAGAWKLTTPDPSQIGEDVYGQARRIVRVTLLIGLGGSVLPLLLDAQPAPPLFIILTALTVASVLVGGVGNFYQLTYISRLALRIPDVLISSRAGFLRWAFVVCWVVLALAGAGLAALAMSAKPTGPSAAGMSGALGLLAIVGAVFGLGLLVFSLMYISMLNRLRTALTREMEAARLLWYAPQATAAGGEPG